MSKPTLKNIPADIYQRTHAKWVLEALASGPSKPFKMKDMDAAFVTGLKRAATRKLVAQASGLSFRASHPKP